MAAAKDDYQWTKEKVDRLRKIAALVQSGTKDVVDEEGAWTVLKLLSSFQLHGTYLPIMCGQRDKGYVDRLFYIDLNAGSGLVHVEGTQALVPGTALIGANVHRVHEHESYDYDYDHYIFVEPIEKKAEALEQRLLEWLPKDKFTLIRKGADDAVPMILSMLTKRDHYLCTFDPYGFEQGTWNGYGKLIANTARGDMFINFQTTSVKRTSEQNRKNFFGPNYPGDYLDRSEDEILQSFRRDILGPNRAVVEDVRIKGGDGFRYYYDMVYAVAQTGGGARFMKAFRDLERRVAKLTGDDIKGMLSNQGLDKWS